jgi:hypothetical protein
MMTPPNAPAQDASSLTEDVFREREARREKLIKEYLKNEKILFSEEQLFEEYGIDGISIYVYLPSRSGVYPADGLDIKTGAENSGGDSASFVLALPLSSGADTEDDVHFGLQFAFQYIKDTIEYPPALPVIVAFLAGERGGDWESNRLTGFAALLDSAGVDYSSIILYADIVSSLSPLRVVRGDDNRALPFPLLSPFIDACAKHHVPIVSSNNSLRGAAQLDMARELDISVLFITNYDGAETAEGGLSVLDISRAIADWSESLQGIHNKLISDNDINYIFVTRRGGNIIIAETSIIIFSFVAILLLLFVLFLLLSRYLRKR